MDFKGTAEHAAEHQHGIQHRAEPPAPQTIEQRVAKLEARVEQLEGAALRAAAATTSQVAGRGPAAIDERRAKSRE